MAKSVNATAYGKRLVDMKVESLTGLASIQASDIEPPADVLNAEPDPSFNTLPAVTQGRLRTKTQPIYPAEAKRIGAQGTVIVEGTIGKDGHVARSETSEFTPSHPDRGGVSRGKEMGI